MRRILLMVPMLAIVACLSDVPTETGTIQSKNQSLNAGQPADAGLQIILEDQVVDSSEDLLEFFVINPYYDLTSAASTLPWHCNGVCQASVVVQGESAEPIEGVDEVDGRAFCEDPDHWTSLGSGDDEPDLAVHLSGADVCSALPTTGGSLVTLEVLLQGTKPDGNPFVLEFSETFRILCPYLDG